MILTGIKHESKIPTHTHIYFFISCSDPLDKPYNENTFASDAVKIGESKKLTPEEVEIFAKFIVASKLTGKDLTGKTYKQIVADAKEAKIKFETEQNAQEKRAAEERAKQEAMLQALKDSLSVNLYDIKTSTENYHSVGVFKLLYNNKTAKKIRAFKGSVIFRDLFDKQLYGLEITDDGGLKPKTEIKWELEADLNPFIQEHKIFMAKKITDLKITWEPEKIIFEDGTTLDNN